MRVEDVVITERMWMGAVIMGVGVMGVVIIRVRGGV